MLTTNTSLGGDVIGIYNSNTVTAIRHATVPAPAASNDVMVMVYGNAGNSFTWQPYPGVGSVTNWSKYRALQIIDIYNYGFTNVNEITFGGDRRTNWPVTNGLAPTNWVTTQIGVETDRARGAETNLEASIIAKESGTNWSKYKALQIVDMDSKGFSNVTEITFGGVTRTNWPIGAGGNNWSEYAATQAVAMASNDLNNVGSITIVPGKSINFGGEIRTTWPASTGGDTWSRYPATQTVNAANNILSNVYGIYLGGVLRTNWTSTIEYWSLYPATTNVNMNNKAIMDVKGIQLGGGYRETWPDIAATIEIAWVSNGPPGSAVVVTNLGTPNNAILGFIIPVGTPGDITGWSGAPATQTVEMANNGFTNVSEITLSGERRTTWPVGNESGTNWSKYPAIQNVDLGKHSITNIGTNSIVFEDGTVLRPGDIFTWNDASNIYVKSTAASPLNMGTNPIVLGGEARTNWPTGEGSGGGSNWSQYVATQLVNMADNGFTNVGEITLGGERRTTWPTGGPAGAAATITIAYVSNGVPGSSVIVTNTGNSNAASFGFVIPVGSNGTDGGSTWSAYPATQSVNMGTNPIVLGGESRTNWPTSGSGSEFHRYVARTNTGEIVEVLATSTNITVDYAATVFTFNIPAGTRIFSAKMRVDGAKTASGVIYLSMGTNDMNNSSAATDWMPITQGYVEGAGTPKTIIAKPDTTDPTLARLQGLDSGSSIITAVRLGF